MEKDTMNRELLKVCSKNNYEKIYSIIESKTVKPSLQYKNYHLSISDFEYLKRYTEEMVIRYLHKEESIPTPLLNLGCLLGEDHRASLQAAITNYVLAQASADLAQFMASSFSGLGSLKEIYTYLENLVDKINCRYHNLPREWAVDLRLVTRGAVMIKQRICDFFYVGECEEEQYVQGLFATIAYEKKIHPFLRERDCCSHRSGMDAGRSASFCMHAKMLSATFVPHIDMYLRYSLGTFVKAPFKQNVCEMSIVEVFLAFFREVEQVWNRLIYIDDQQAFQELVVYVDRNVCALVKKLRPDERLSSGLTVLGTLVYVRETLQDLLIRAEEWGAVQVPTGALEEAGRAEAVQARKIEKLLMAGFPTMEWNGCEADKLQAWAKGFLENAAGLAEEVKGVIGEMVMGHLFVEIGRVRMSTQRAEAVLCDICEFERFLSVSLESTPHIRLIKDYLKIFACPTDDKLKFIENFTVISRNMFSFNQVLAGMEDSSEAAELFIEYKKIENSK